MSELADTTADVAVAEQQVRSLEQARIDALSRHDVETVSALMAEELVHIHVTGKVENKRDFIEHLRAQPRKTERLSLDVRVYGDTAVMTGDVANTLTRPGQTTPEVVTMRVTQVAHRSAGSWKFVSFHACRF
ncbi:hypothetical protein BH09PSE5_BH09PSE5_05690 [soil metagenome]